MHKQGMIVQGDGHNMLSIALPNESRIVGMPENETSVRGFSDVSLRLVYQAARVSEQIYRALRPTLVVRDGNLWLMSSPNGKRGFFRDELIPGSRRERISVPATAA